MNGVEEDESNTMFLGKVIRPLRSVDPSQNDYQGLIEITEEGEWQAIFFCVRGPFKIHLEYFIIMLETMNSDNL